MKVLKFRNNDSDRIINFVTIAQFSNKALNAKIDLDFEEAETACCNLRELLTRCRSASRNFIPSLEPVDENMFFSVKSPEKPPFIVRTNNPAAIEKIYQSWQH